MFHSDIPNRVSNVRLANNRDVVMGNDVLLFELNVLQGNENDSYLIYRR